MLFLGAQINQPIIDEINRRRRVLVIATREIIDQLTFPESYRVTYFDPREHTFDILRGKTKLRCRNLSEIFYSRPSSQGGADTLTVRNGKRTLTRLLWEAKQLDKLSKTNAPANIEANDLIDDVLFSDFLPHVLLNKDNFKSSGTILARLDPAELGEDDAFLIGNLLIERFKGQIVIPDYALYQCPFHLPLIRQGRLTAGLHFLDELSPKIRQNLLLSGPRYAKRCSSADAEVIAAYDCPNAKGTRGYREFIEGCVE